MVKTTTCQAHFVAGQRFRTSLASQEPISGGSLGLLQGRPTWGFCWMGSWGSPNVVMVENGLKMV